MTVGVGLLQASLRLGNLCLAKKGVGTEECGPRANTHPRTRLRTREEDGEEVAIESGTAGDMWGLWEE